MGDLDTILQILAWVSGLIVSIGMPVLIAVLRYMSRETKDAERKAESIGSELQNFRVEVAKTYVSNEQLDKFESRIDLKFAELREFLKDHLQLREK